MTDVGYFNSRDRHLWTSYQVWEMEIYEDNKPNLKVLLKRVQHKKVKRTVALGKRERPRRAKWCAADRKHVRYEQAEEFTGHSGQTREIMFGFNLGLGRLV
jgi:hypothetical protein